MTPYQVTYPNTWRDNLVIWSSMTFVGPLFLLIVLALFVEPLFERRGV